MANTNTPEEILGADRAIDRPRNPSEYALQLYYKVKPLIPQRMRFALRRLRAFKKREAHHNTWPINEAAGNMPASWPGWSGGKQLSFVITHDVEGPAGLAKVRQLAELEMKLGFRSSFNFIPEGSYTVPASLRNWLTENGFEVGVHDLHHDGKLYSSRKQFGENARQINQYLKEWGAVGYRSGFMLRNLEWHHEMNLEYDASTFDTDPFEPQPDGTGTIFPFWVQPTEKQNDATKSSGSNPAHAKNIPGKNGYVELPYTLPQDSTLFLLFKEKGPAIWLRKLDWIAERNGMALVNVHPDYLCFEGEDPSANSFPVRFYTELLQTVTNKYAGRAWNPLPRELASWFRTACPAPKKTAEAPVRQIRQMNHAPTETVSVLRGKRAAVLLYSNFPSDPRPYRAARAMVEAGMEVDMLCLKENENQPPVEFSAGVRVFRVPIKHRRSGALMYFVQYGRFIWSAFWFLTKHSLRKKYDLVHVHNMPDILVFSTLVPKLQGAKIILDLHDPMPELMMTIYNVKPGSAWVTLLKFLEKQSMRFANSIVTVNEACRKIFASRSCPLEKVHVVMNAPDDIIFKPRNSATAISPIRERGTPFIIMYHGSMVERHGLDLAVAALAKVKSTIPEAKLHIYGRRNAYFDEVLKSAAAGGLAESVCYFGNKSQEEVAAEIARCDIGVIPNRRSIFTELNTPTRIFEYLSQSKPVIAPSASGIQDYFGPDDLVYFELGDVDDLAKKIIFVYQEPVAVAEIVKRGQVVYRRHDWSQERSRLMNLYTQTLAGAKGPDKVLTPDVVPR